MTTTESTHAKRADHRHGAGFKNPVNWAIGPVAGIAVAAVLVGVAKFVPTWAVYLIVVIVAFWVVATLIDQVKHGKPKANA